MSLLCILKTIVAWLILVLVGTNLIGFIVRGFFWAPPSIDSPAEGVQEILDHKSKRMSVANSAITFLSIVLTAVYLFTLFYFWNVFLAVAAGVIMASRIPDLIWEIRTGSKVTLQSAPKGPLYIVATIIQWGALPLIWYALCW